MKNKNKKCMKIAEKDFTNKLKIVTEIFWKKAKDIQREYWKNRYKNLPVEDK